ncbi:methyl-accepting chemotaxis protein [Geobacter pelophilus]|uniref:Methyl-accepting chemotaxis protein n=1 Tax=Geoanaerobacter pelophilus TaxID=60036 RepID=A0AAW4L5S3_9BACT|nr:methyl-accepting chemotaxis protein [Geoanaerobacter pelophilus]MBT0665522.1 methyl-accepting chemotaxis protein [Geoanaerobacter pelophilus]
MFKNLKVATRLYGLIGFMAVLLLIIGFLGLHSAKLSDDALDTVYLDRVVPLKDLKVIADMYAVNIVDTSHKVRNGNLQWGDGRKNVDEAVKTIAEKWKGYLATTLVAEEKRLVEEIRPMMKVADEAVAKLGGILAKEDADALARFTISELYPAIDPVSDKFGELVDIQLKVAKEEHQRSSAEYLMTRNISMVAIAIGVLLAYCFGVLIVRSVTGPLKAGVDAAHRIAAGDLTVVLAADSTNETGQLMSAMKQMVEHLREMIMTLNDISSFVASASNQLHATSEQIANGAEEVANQTNTVATASEEMAATSSDIARNCTMVAESSRCTAESATAGAKVVEETINGMCLIADRVRSSAKTVEALGSRSDQIGEIVGTIEDIADQTNLLALNAAIEAARAGEQGRGFAVVADEVRALAERTTKATREIGDMIKAIQKETQDAVKAMDEGVREVEKGAETSQKSGTALNEILHLVNDVSMQISQIATASEEQTATTGDLTSNIHQISEVVEQTARGAEETATAAAQLAAQASELQNLVRRFKLT